MKETIVNGKVRKAKAHEQTYIGARIPTPLYNEVQEYADSKDLSFSYVVRRALEAFVEQVKK